MKIFWELLHVLRDILAELKEILVVLKQSRNATEDLVTAIDELIKELQAPFPTGFSVQVKGDTVPFASSAVATATPLDSDKNPTSLPAGTPDPIWTASDPSITLSPSGLSCSLSFTTNLTGASVTLTATLPSGVVVVGVSDPFDVVLPAKDPASFSIKVA